MPQLTKTFIPLQRLDLHAKMTLVGCFPLCQTDLSERKNGTTFYNKGATRRNGSYNFVNLNRRVLSTTEKGLNDKQ